MAPSFEHYGVQLWMPEVGGAVDFQAEGHEAMMIGLGIQSKREITRTRIRVRTAMAAQTREQGRYLGGRPPYGYRLADAGPHPNRAHAAWGRRARRLETDPETAPIVMWIFAQRLAGHSLARITRALNDASIPCPSAADPGRNTHRAGQAWMLTTVRAILANPRYTGRQVWNRQPTAMDLIDPSEHRARAPAGAAVGPARGLGYLRPPVAPGAGQRGGFHRRAGHPRRTREHGHRKAPPASRAAALRDLRASARVLLGEQPSGLPVPPRVFQHQYAGPRPAEEPLHPRGSHPAAPARPVHPPGRNGNPAGRRRRRTRQGTDVATPVSDAKAISYLRSSQITLTYDPRSETLQADTTEAVTAIVGRAS
jgi:site-specific DNA recombinase